MSALLAFSLLWLAPALACGSFAPRPTPTPTEAVIVPVEGVTQSTPIIAAQGTPIPVAPTSSPTPTTTPTFTPTPIPGTALAVGQPARVTAPDGLNLREQASTNGVLLSRLGTGQRVNVVEGPVSADGFIWWKVDDGQGNAGWAAEGDGETDWLSPRIGDPQPVNRPPRVGDRVVVTTEAGQQLTIRALPGVDAPLTTRVNPGEQFNVVAGPQAVGGFSWYQIRNDAGTLEGWAADGDGTRRWLSPLE